MPKKPPNILFFGIDSLRRDHMSHYGYGRLTTPHITKYAEGGVTFENCFSAHIPTSSGYSNMLTGRDCFGTGVVALRHVGQIAEGVPTLAEILRDHGYVSTSVGYEGNPGSRGFDKYLHFQSWFAETPDGRIPKAMNLNQTAIPELERLSKGKKPFFLFLRHMEPHSPYLAPEPFQSMFFQGDAFDKNDDRMKKVYDFKPFGDFIKSWTPEGCTNPDYVIAQYDAEIAYMDACIAHILEKLSQLGLEENTLVVFASDHGETLYDHDCHFDHHGLYDPTLVVPLIFKWKGKLPGGIRRADTCQLKDVTPTILDVIGLDTGTPFDGRSLYPLVKGEPRDAEPEIYITECTWMRKHGWRTPEWKLIRALEPDFHFKPEIELYNLIKDPGENFNAADENPEIVEALTKRMNAHIKKREKETGRPNPMYTNVNWHGGTCGAFKTSKQAYETMYIGSINTAMQLQQKDKKA
ncbi:MAG: sulfatase-like hydrolase/transferase [Defluviitaleaceae bacterium]|nr:sulfatase-like hydrolase/transferase [Defluviitaleaceae bacterium]